jgi:hypothetical protein
MGASLLGAEPGGDLVQAGPLLVHEGRSAIDGTDPEGFSAGAAQFDSDITAGRHPRCALGVGERELLAVCCDGRPYSNDGQPAPESRPIVTALLFDPP